MSRIYEDDQARCLREDMEMREEREEITRDIVSKMGYASIIWETFMREYFQNGHSVGENIDDFLEYVKEV